MVGMNVVGGKKARSSESLTNKGCIFGSMAGMPPTIGVPSSLVGVYQRETSYCNLQQGCWWCWKNAVLSWYQTSVW